LRVVSPRPRAGSRGPPSGKRKNLSGPPFGALGPPARGPSSSRRIKNLSPRRDSTSWQAPWSNETRSWLVMSLSSPLTPCREELRGWRSRCFPGSRPCHGLEPASYPETRPFMVPLADGAVVLALVGCLVVGRFYVKLCPFQEVAGGWKPSPLRSLTMWAVLAASSLAACRPASWED
jgi:hypothetical protein